MTDNDFTRGLSNDPRTGAMPRIPHLHDEGHNDAETQSNAVEQLRSNAQNLEETLIGGKRVLKRKQVAQLAGVPLHSVRKFWRSLGLPQIPEDRIAYTVEDVAAVSEISEIVDSSLLDEDTVLALARAIGQTTDRLVVWQMESLVEYLVDAKGLSESEARAVALPLLEQLLEPLENVLLYSWKHNMANVIGRLNLNVAEGLAMDNRSGWFDSAMPLARAVGFVDLVSYTRLSQQLEPKQLAFLVKRFQDIAYTIIATGGGRVIKTVGDEVYFAAETPLAGAEISTRLMEVITEDEMLPRARVGFAWGKVLSRLGDIFGSTVNLAARLTAIADPGAIVTDLETARIIERTDAYVFSNRRAMNLQGLGEVQILDMKRGTAEPLNIELS